MNDDGTEKRKLDYEMNITYLKIYNKVEKYYPEILSHKGDLFIEIDDIDMQIY